jgi:hypothetical protein
MVVDYFSPSDAIEVNINWAFNYLYDIITAAIYLGVTGIALMGASPAPMPKTDSTIELSPSTRPYVSL